MKLLKICLSLAIAVLSACVASALDFAVAGVPMQVAKSREYGALFSELSRHGVDAFFPVFQYEEAPRAKTLGFEPDFVPPCSADAGPFPAMRANRVRLIVPAGLLYDPARQLPPLSRDPLKALLACVGEEGLAAVLSYDEPAQNGVPLRAVAALYQRVKEVAPQTPVMMVHAPLVIEPGRHDSEAARVDYLNHVAALSESADIVGFSTYPIPPIVAKMGAPGYGDAVVGADDAAYAYVAWMRLALPEKRRMAVLQVFSYADQYDPDYLDVVASRELQALVRGPTSSELRRMTELSRDEGVEWIVWYGAAFTRSGDDPSWRAALRLSREFGGAR